jgi:3-hydroxy-9,10-secoandrosta-1,3,5(10)-triene-9,17-dione monooxygenase reductase component
VTDTTSGVPFDGEHFRHVLSHYPTGVVVVTAVAGDGGLAGMAVGSFTSVSLNPPLVAYLDCHQLLRQRARRRSALRVPRVRHPGW